MNAREIYYFLDALKTEFPRMDFPVSCNCTEERRKEFRGKVMEALESALVILRDLEDPDTSVQQ